MPRDVKKITSLVDIVEVISPIIPLTRSGSGFMGVCPFHNDHKKSLSISRSKQRFKCFACGAGGDLVDFFIRRGNTFHEAVDIIQGKATETNPECKVIHIEKSQSTWTQINHPDWFPKKIRHFEHGKPSAVWGYHNADGTPMGYICRFDLPDESKEVIPYVFATDGSRRLWRWMGFGKPRPLYNLQELSKYPDRSVIVVEGEKSADAAKRLLTKYIIVSWQGGAEAIHNTDFSPLNGRTILYWPDNDSPGFKAMIGVSGLVDSNKHYFINPTHMPVHWDIADEPGWTTRDAIDFIRDNITDELIIENLKEAI